MRRLFTGRFRGIPVALLTALLLVVVSASGLLAATSFTLHEVPVEIKVMEPIEMMHGPEYVDPLPNPLSTTALFSYQIYAGSCIDRWISIENKADADNWLRICAAATWDGDPGPDLTLTWWSWNGTALEPIADASLVLVDVQGGNTAWVVMRVCADGSMEPTDPLKVTLDLAFTRESVPV